MDEHQTDPVGAVQDAMLPSGLPMPQGVALAARYFLAETDAGGDWFDAIALDDGRLVVSVGDVAGCGVEAAMLSGELRAVFDDRVRDEGDLNAGLEALDSRARRSPEARATTVCVAVLDPVR